MDTMLHPPFHTEISMAKTQTTIPETDTTQPDATVAAPSAATVEKDTASEKTRRKNRHRKRRPRFRLRCWPFSEFPDYKELYIDADGSMYTPQTTPAIRGKAILYKNPYYKS